MKPCDCCNRNVEVRSIWLVCISMRICRVCYGKLQRAKMAPQNIPWEGVASNHRQAVK
jgi:hypothetical protein